MQLASDIPPVGSLIQSEIAIKMARKKKAKLGVVEKLHDSWYRSKKDTVVLWSHRNRREIQERVEHILIMKYGISRPDRGLVMLNIQPVIQGNLKPSKAARNIAEILEPQWFRSS